MNYCAPNVANIDISSHYTCFELEELKEIALAFNIYIHTNNICSDKNRKICVPKKLIDIKNKNKKELWQSIYDRLDKICKYEYCWIDLEFVKSIPNKHLRQKIKEFTFKPKMTMKQYSWLSTNDINSVLKQYEKIDPSFYYFGALPCDFYNITSFDYSKIIECNKYKLIGIVFNLDTHDKSGSHWVSMVIDNKIKQIEYFDSVGNKPNKYIKKFINNIMKDNSFILKINNIIHQRENSECGIYSIYFIIQRLFGKSFDDITTNIIRDKSMNRFRKYIFRPRK